MNKITQSLSRYLKPSQISKLYVFGAIVGVFAICITVMEMNESERRVRNKESEVTNIITSKNSREYGLDAVNSKVNIVSNDVRKAKEKMERLEAENEKLKKNSHASITLAERLETALQKIQQLENEIEENERKSDEKIQSAVNQQLTEKQVEEILKESNSKENGSSNPTVSKVRELQVQPQRRPSRNTNFSYGKKNDNGAEKTTTDNKAVYANASSSPFTPSRTSELFTISEEAVQEETDKEEEKIYLPKSSILTGVLITGLDAPTQASAAENPLPVLLRLKKEAILPNFYTLDEVNECFAIMAGYGDLSTERANLRGESITCVKKDGSVIESNFGGYAVGEDGKAGLKGTLVSRNATVLANAMMAGFGSGLASMFTVDAVPTISTNSDGSVEYNSVYSSSAVQGGAATGAATAMEKLADYYMNLADSIHPVIEIGAGRVVDVIVTKGVNL